ncbi:MAG TPA: hydroxylamine reductase [Candidatus Mcinerneyibacteriales bacterium]|nr:hydroxylamine reductase [Candidatus Mcinerneyibacteriales bacterium]HPE19718.1 hydroxylamine reductase [Candidatus Mcinerneyibacteriales bacterium]HPJ69819.1 hydroxylamine reductase [Candidatus Mcinerneyibacteriales bacterium]
MSMFCYQCQETAGNKGCKVRGVCGKPEKTAVLMDALMEALKGLAVALREKGEAGETKLQGPFIARALFATITNANFDDERIASLAREALKRRDSVASGMKGKEKFGSLLTWTASTEEEFLKRGYGHGVLATEHEDIRSLRELTVYGLKGIAAYVDHAHVLGYEDPKIYDFFVEALSQVALEEDPDKLTALVLKTGETAVAGMALLDKANTGTYGHPEITEVNIGVGKNPGILISGHDLKDMEELLKQTEGTGVDVYTHGEMLPANYYPAFKKYSHFVGNYGNAWWKQNEEFEAFNGPILMTTNCIIPVKESYKDRIFTTGMTGYPGVKHIPDREEGKEKDFSALISLAKKCSPPREIEKGTIVGGFAHNQVLALADKVVEAVKSGAIKRFVVMAGCDGRFTSRQYYTDVAKALPEDAVILTAGCAKYRYNKLDLGDIGGIPRVLDAGQCNDSYSLAVIALKLKEVFGLDDINKLPLSFDIAWYEQKAVAVLLALLFLGVKGIRLGPTLPAFLSPNVAKVLVEKFDIKPIGEVESDVEMIMQGK